MNEASEIPILEIRELGKSFGGVEALHDITFSVPSGVIQSIIGPNGAGKTTLLNCVSGIIKPSHGKIYFLGKPIENLPPHRIATLGISRTFQHVALFKRMTVIENVAIGRHSKTRSGFLACTLRLSSMRREERDIFTKAEEWLEFVGLSDEMWKEAGSLPLGKQKLLEVARALAAEPRLLLLDEPAGGLNTSETEQFGDLIERIRNLGITILLIEHDMNLVMEKSDYVVVLHYGKLLATGTPREIKRNPQVIEVYLGKEE
ncbi:MAG: ABC transporter ATP-binding protein [Syntrophobacterales bacterium]|nr:ABC transporter ATP-binding protein [Syntrophobacterales bacterium]